MEKNKRILTIIISRIIGRLKLLHLVNIRWFSTTKEWPRNSQPLAQVELDEDHCEGCVTFQISHCVLEIKREKFYGGLAFWCIVGRNETRRRAIRGNIFF